MCCVKLALVVFFNNIAVDQFQKRLIMLLGAVCTASAVCMLFAAAFQCGASKAWEVMKLHCFDQVRSRIWKLLEVYKLTSPRLPFG